MNQSAELFLHGVCQGCGQPTEEHDRTDEERCAVDVLFRSES